MERPPGVPAELWHDEPPEVVLRAVEEMARFYWEMGMRFDEPEETLPPDWRDQLRRMLPDTE